MNIRKTKLGLAIGLLLAQGVLASAGPATYEQDLNVNFYNNSKITAQNYSFDLDLKGRKEFSGQSELIISGYDIDELNEGSIEIGSCAPILFPDEKTALNDSKDGAVGFFFPTSCLAQGPNPVKARIVISHVDQTLGFKIYLLSFYLPVEKVYAPPVVSLIGRLQREGVLVDGIVPSEKSYRKVFTVWGFNHTAFCLVGLKDEHRVVTTTPYRLFMWGAGYDEVLQLYPDYCSVAWSACGFSEDPICPPVAGETGSVP